VADAASIRSDASGVSHFWLSEETVPKQLQRGSTFVRSGDAVRTISNSVDLATWRALGTRSGGETVQNLD